MMKIDLQLFALYYNNNRVNLSDGGGKKKDDKKNDGGGGSKPVTTYAAPSGNTGAAKSNISGVDQATIDKMNSTFTQSQGVTDAQNEANAYRDKLKEITSVTDIVDQSTWDTINSKFAAPSKYDEAMEYTNGLLSQLSSGRTSYTDQIKDLMGKIQNRDPFEYDVDSDLLFQQYLASSMQSGKTAMQDTMGQAAALTGGYGSSYATSASNQAYNAYIQDAYNNLPEYYNMAMEAYQMEGEEMYNQLAMLNEADAKEYGRLYDAWSANYTTAQDMYKNAYTEWNDTVNNAISSANLQLNEHGQLVDDAYKAYTAVQDHAQTLYNNEYTQWADMVTNAQTYAKMANSDYWSTQNFIEGQRQFNASLSQKASQFAEDMAYKEKALQQDDEQFYAKMVADKSPESVTTEPTETQMKKALEAYNTGGEEALMQYVDSLPTDIDIDAIDKYIFGDEKSGAEGYGILPVEKRTFTKTKDTVNGLWGIDNNDEVVDQYGNVFRIDDLPENLQKELTKLKKDEKYTAK
jgi:hypothetical protein